MERQPSYLSSGQEVDAMLDQNVARLRKLVAEISHTCDEPLDKENTPKIANLFQSRNPVNLSCATDESSRSLPTAPSPADQASGIPGILDTQPYIWVQELMRATSTLASSSMGSNSNSRKHLDSQATSHELLPSSQSCDQADVYASYEDTSDIQIHVERDTSLTYHLPLHQNGGPTPQEIADGTDALEVEESVASLDLTTPAAHRTNGNKRGSLRGSIGSVGTNPCRSISMFPGGLKVLVATWNIGNAMPLRSELVKWLPLNPACHIVAVGVQECSFKPSKARLAEIEDEWAAMEQWEGKRSSRTRTNGANRNSSRAKAARRGSAELPRPVSVGAVLGPDASEEQRKLTSKAAKTLDSMVLMHYGPSYRKVARVRLGDMRLIVLVKVELRAQISQVRKAHKATGIAGVVGNKGGLMVKLRVADIDLCFLSCHLAAHESEEKVAKRNQDLHEILKAASNSMKPGLDIAQQCDHTFIFGDLNYRIDLSITDKKVRDHDKHHEKVVELIKHRKGKRIVAADQLQREIKEQHILFGFNESIPTFAPTFKLFRKSGWHYNPQRIPSYCDRVLWTSLPGASHKINQILYSSSKDVSTSDHKPVFSIFRIDVETGLEGSEIDRAAAQAAAGHSVLHRRFKNSQKTDSFLLLTCLRIKPLGDRIRCNGQMVVRFQGPVQTLEKQVHLSQAPPASLTSASLGEILDEVIDSTKLGIRSGTSLEHHHLTISLWERQKATTKVFGSSPMVLLGQCTLDLHPWSMDHSRQPINLPIVRYGVLVGTMDGELELEKLW